MLKRVVMVSAVAVSSWSTSAQACEPFVTLALVPAQATFAGRVVPRNVELRLVGDFFEGSSAVLTAPDGTTTTLAWNHDGDGWVLPRDGELAVGHYTLDLRSNGEAVVDFDVEDVLDTDAPAAPVVDVVWDTIEPTLGDRVFCSANTSTTTATITVDNAAGGWLLVNGRARSLPTAVVIADEGAVQVQLVDLAGNVSDVVVADVDSAGGCSGTSTPSALWVLALLLLARRRRR
jgi:MYXO-CTERM domain-containing protein